MTHIAQSIPITIFYIFFKSTQWQPLPPTQARRGNQMRIQDLTLRGVTLSTEGEGAYLTCLRL